MRLWHIYFPRKFGKFSENTSYKEQFWATASIVIAWNNKLLSFSFFLLTFPLFIYWSFNSLRLCFVLLIKWLWWCKYILNLTQFAIMFCNWINCHLVFFFKLMSSRKREKKTKKCPSMFYLWFRENPNSLHFN